MDQLEAKKPIEFSASLSFLLTESARYKVLYGGRGAGKSVAVARALLLFAIQRKVRILCLREFQNSISESVYELLKEQIYAMEIEDRFKILASEIICIATGSEFFFKGIRYNIESIKSLASVDICWVEEANTVSKTSWDKLGPTIRGRHETDPRGNLGPFGKGPEIIVTFNPELDTDETYKRFVLNPPSEFDAKGNKYSIIKKVNWSDNPWLPDDLKEEMEQLKKKDETSWLTVWEGHCRQTLEGSIFAEEIKRATLEGRIKNIKYDPSRPVFTYWDLGYADKTAIWFVQTIGVEYNLINYYENNLQKIPHYIKVLQDLPYNYSVHNLPHDGDAETASNISPKKQLQAIGWKVRIIERPRKKFLGINASRSIFELCNFDEQACADGLQCLRRYCYKVDQETGNFSKEPDHDTPWSHGSDAFQTLALSLKSETASKKPERTIGVGRQVVPFRQQNSWMG